MIRQLATENGINPDFLVKVAEKESSLNPMAGTKYKGLFQIGDGEARSLGITNVYDPRQNTIGAIKYMKNNRKCLEKNGIKEWKDWYYYLAHQQGCSGATYLINNSSKKLSEITARARKNILSNVPTAKKSQMITVQNFLDHWQNILQPTLTPNTQTKTDSVQTIHTPTANSQPTPNQQKAKEHNVPLLIVVIIAFLLPIWVYFTY